MAIESTLLADFSITAEDLNLYFINSLEYKYDDTSKNTLRGNGNIVIIPPLMTLKKNCAIIVMEFIQR